jgi:hypothetical protein
VEFEVSNRVQNVPRRAALQPRLFARAHVHLDLSLGQLLRNAVFDEAEPEFQQYAFFNTRIGQSLLRLCCPYFLLYCSQRIMADDTINHFLIESRTRIFTRLSIKCNVRKSSMLSLHIHFNCYINNTLLKIDKRT